MQNGITLIALVISIIVMLILAGVSISAIVGDDGVLSKAQYASFINEMSAIEEAVQLWKVNQDEMETAIPTSGICQANILDSGERIKGEIGFYRNWCLTKTTPLTPITTKASDFNMAFSGEIVYYPGGVQDLFYLNNDELGISKNKKYLIDATNGMIYSTTGLTINGVRVYSLNMAKAMNGGALEMPVFVAAEVSGVGATGGGQILAGNKEPEYLLNDDGTVKTDDEGNPISNPNYNPNAFQIISDPSSENIFKLYNNGDLYGKGIKGKELNTDTGEMEELNEYIWHEYNNPVTITSGIKKTYIGCNSSIYYVDNNDDLWVIGENTNNRFGLTANQQKEYTGKEITKVDLGSEKVDQLWSGAHCSFIKTKSGKLLASGSNAAGELGLGNTVATNRFVEVTSLENTSHISKVYCMVGENNNQQMVIVRYDDNTFWYSGKSQWGQLGTGDSQNYKSTNVFLQIWNGTIGADIDQDIEDLVLTSSVVWFEKIDDTDENLNGKAYFAGYSEYFGGGLKTVTGHGGFRQYSNENLNNIVDIKYTKNSIVFTKKVGENDKEVWVNRGTSQFFDRSNVPILLDITGTDLETEKVKEVYTTNNGVYLLSKANKLYAIGNNNALGLNLGNGTTKEITYLDRDEITSLYSSDVVIASQRSSIIILNDSGKRYITEDKLLMFGEKILQKNWTLVAQNVAYKAGIGDFYVDKNKCLWVNGDARICGLGIEEYEYIPKFKKCTDENIDKHVVKAWQKSKVTYVLLDDNSLWSTGLTYELGQEYWPGWAEAENKSRFVKILDDVTFFDCNSSTHLAITTETAYSWGYKGNWGFPENYSKIPVELTLPSEIGGVENISKVIVSGAIKIGIITKDGKFFTAGLQDGREYDGGATIKKEFHEYTYNITLDEDEKIIDAIQMNYDNCLILTDKGKVFGWGNKDFLGIGSEESTFAETQLLRGISNINSINSGLNWYVVVDNEGKVFGTGKNKNGVLGRWKGVGRGDSNSSYKTAFNWVECPDLEI